MFILIDNYDSFTYNLYHFLGELGARFEVHRNDRITVDAIEAMNPQGIVISPGPRDPDHAGICVELVERLAPTVPMLGVCLGHQTMGQVYGGTVCRGPMPMHGKVSTVHTDGRGLFEGLPRDFEVTRYHSLVVGDERWPEVLEKTAWTDDGVIMGLKHRDYPCWGVQFHPESLASEHGHRMLANFLRLAGFNGAPIQPIEEIEARLKRSGTHG
ncbi:DNA-binding transcriptional activator, 3HPP-binding [alpha proteobacterium BAL199]|jgi:anthranilate synthase component II|nr:DNA-binding transcriptional activator, 3HPP-binding [alpha proteobacterium BAL199]